MQQALAKWLLAPQRPGLGRVVGGFGARPDFLIIGTQKGGSTSLYRYLTAHPKIRSAAVKEIHYFSYHHASPESWYRAHFPPAFWLEARGLKTGEASVSHLHVPAAAGRVAAFAPAAKLIVMLRNPVSRAFSHYQMSVKQGHETLPFAEALALEPERLQRERERLGTDAAYSQGKSHRYHSYLLRGHYAEQLERWFAHFPREQFLILSSEHFFKNPSDTYHDVLSFLDLPEIDLPSYRQLNKGSEARPDLPAELRGQLELYFAPHNARLEGLLELPSPEVSLPARPDSRTAPPTRASHRPRARVLTDGAFGSQRTLSSGDKRPPP